MDAMLRLIDRGIGPRAMSVEAIASEAGVGKATIYRRWPNKDALLLHMLEQVDADAEAELDPTGRSLRDVLVLILDSIRRRKESRAAGTNLAVLAAELRSVPELNAAFHRDVIGPRRAALHQLIADAQQRGEIRPDLDPTLVGELIVGPMLSRTLLHCDEPPADARFSEQIVDAVLEGIAVRRNSQSD